MVDAKSDKPKPAGDTFLPPGEAELAAERSRPSSHPDAPTITVSREQKRSNASSAALGDRSKPPKIRRAPLAWLTTIGALVLTPLAYQRFIENHVVIAYDEYYAALAKGHTKHCLWIVARCVVLVVLDLVKEVTWWIRQLFSPRDDE